MTLEERAAAFNQTYEKWPASHLHVVKEQNQPVIYGRWLIGQDYRNKTSYYGAYPAGYLDRVMRLFPDTSSPYTSNVLHVFSGSLPPGPYMRCDLTQDADFRCNVYDLPEQADVRFPDKFELVLADPPYTAKDAEQYGTAGIDRSKATTALARVTRPGGHLVWLDVCWPMHSKRFWRTVGRIVLTRSTNHRTRDITIFERTGS